LEQPELKLLLALGIGLLVGVERERSKGSGPSRGAAGLRTFGLIGLVGGAAGLFGQPLLVAVAGLFVAAAAVASYRRSRPDDPGLTTEVAMFATYLLGVMTADRPQAAVAAGVVMAVLLAARAPLQALVRDILTQREIMDGLAFAIAALVVLPLLPNRAVDPLGVLNPFALWRLAVVMMGLSALGYVAQRLAGGQRGLLLAGLAGGLVSSTATIAGMARRARETPAATPADAAAGVASMLSSMAYLAVLLATLRPQVLAVLALPMLAGGTVILAYAVFLARRGDATPPSDGAHGRAFDLRATAVFVGLVAACTLVSRLLELWLGDRGVLAGAAATGLADAHAAALSVTGLAAAGKLADAVAGLGVLAALVANMLIKAPTAWVLGGTAYGVRVSLGAVLLSAGALVGAIASGLLAG
ncbi:MAG: MgtC/SapB family protein, partial [Phenylobacterium sp.]